MQYPVLRICRFIGDFYEMFPEWSAAGYSLPMPRVGIAVLHPIGAFGLVVRRCAKRFDKRPPRLGHWISSTEACPLVSFSLPTNTFSFFFYERNPSLKESRLRFWAPLRHVRYFGSYLTIHRTNPTASEYSSFGLSSLLLPSWRSVLFVRLHSLLDASNS